MVYKTMVYKKKCRYAGRGKGGEVRGDLKGENYFSKGMV
jgi:hypothetical protein